MDSIKFNFTFSLLSAAALIFGVPIAQADETSSLIAEAPELAAQSKAQANAQSKIQQQELPVQSNNVTAVPVRVLYVSENQPVQIVDPQGRLLQVIYLKRK
jgi:hypothetical protein